MVQKILHYVYYANPISSGYTIRTHSIVKAQKKRGMHPNVAISLKSTIKNYFNNVKFKSILTIDKINYFSPYNELLNNKLVKHLSKILFKKNKLVTHLQDKIYNFEYQKILNDYYKYLSPHLKGNELIHVHTPAIAFDEAEYLNKTFRNKIIYEIRGFWNLSLENDNPDITKLVENEINACHKADKCIAICNGIADILVKGGVESNKIEIVPNAVAPEKFPLNSKNIEFEKKLNVNGKIIYGYISSIRWFEGVQTIIKAWPKILKEIPNAIFLLIGDGPYLNTLRLMIKEFGIENSFLILGRIPHQDIPLYYSIIDIFVVPRINVPVSQIVTPLKPLEAMINAKSIIISDVKALQEMVINGETGVYFNADDHNHLARVSIKLAKEKGLRDSLGKNARKWVLKNRTWDIIANQYSDIYKDVLK